MTELILVRHGRTQANMNGVYCGRHDLPLTQEGLEDARRTALALSAFNPSHIFCSDTLRTRQTARIIAPGTEAVIRPDLREMSFGAFEGLCADEIQRCMPDRWQAYMDDYMSFTFPGGDNVRSYLTKASETINGIIREAQNCRVLAVSHKGFILSALSSLLHGDSEHTLCYDIKPGGFARLSLGDDFAVLRQLT